MQVRNLSIRVLVIFADEMGHTVEIQWVKRDMIEIFTFRQKHPKLQCFNRKQQTPLARKSEVFIL